ncbi:TorF family putative porin [Sphingomonas sp. ac-8]|uniref:TorF family putative porin n=1 Tax=Sphingomonas sp. ac-8 TaxID=3242977 RepID=UPI003A7F6694
MRLRCSAPGADPRLSLLAGAALLSVTAALPAHAQSETQRPTLSVELTTDARERGISWSDGDASLRGSATIPLGDQGFSASASVATLNDSPRHGGAAVGIDLGASYAQYLGPVRVDGGVTGHFFPGSDRALSYVELGGGAGFALGPVQLDGFARYAPKQSAIGGDNFYVGAEGRLGIPVTPFTLIAGIGHTSGNVDDAVRAARLRPGGSYMDWRLGVEHVTGPLVLGLDYVDTDISDRAIVPSPYADGGNADSRLLARVGLNF